MTYGNPRRGSTLTYPEDSIQSIFNAWWLEDSSHGYQRGRLIRAFLPHVEQVPKQIIATGRASPTDHVHANYEICPLQVCRPATRPSLPVAALPAFEGEVNAVYRAKKRPALIICEGGEEVARHLTLGQPKWQTAQTLLVAPYYGITEGTGRAGFPPEFVKRVRQCEYSRFMWDALPIGGSATESIMRIDHIQPIGQHHDSIEMTNYRLNKEAIAILDEWLDWLITGEFDEGSMLLYFKENIESSRK